MIDFTLTENDKARLARTYPLVIAGAILLATLAIQPTINATIGMGLFARVAFVIVARPPGDTS